LVVVQRGVAVADSFNYMHKSLKEIQTNLGTEIDVSAGQVNSILKQVSELNTQIQQVEPNGYLPNDLYDARDALLDELSGYFPIETNYEKSGGRASAVAEGSVTVTLKMKDGTKVELVNGSAHAKMETNPPSLHNVSTNENNLISGLKITQPNGTTVQSGTYIVIDDIYTTGTTLLHAATVLKEAGATRVEAVTLIRAER